MWKDSKVENLIQASSQKATNTQKNLYSPTVNHISNTQVRADFLPKLIMSSICVHILRKPFTEHQPPQEGAELVMQFLF